MRDLATTVLPARRLVPGRRDRGFPMTRGPDCFRETLKVLGDHDDLHLERSGSDDLEMISGDHDDVDIGGLFDQPV